MRNIYLLRHGQTAYNADHNRYSGRTDIPLTELGLAQAAMVHEQVKGITFDGVYSSPLQRAFNTAGIASGMDVTKDDRLIEVDFGSWEHKTQLEFYAENPKLWNDWDADPGNTRAGGTGETGLQVVNRVDEFFNELQAKHTGGNFMVVAHNGVNRLYMAYKLGMPLKNYRRLVQQNSSITMFTLDDDGTLTLNLLNAKL